MKNLTSVAILLTTWNSEQFLTELIESILGQDYSDWTLYIGDDGSTDGTLDIIAHYANNHKDKIILLDFPKKNAGASLGFERLMRYIDSSYYMFCDHDDVWLTHKISLSLSRMKSAELEFPKKPFLVHTDLTVVDRGLNVISKSFSTYSGINPEIFNNHNFYRIANCVTGCTILLNDPAKKVILPFPGQSMMYDWWIALNLSENGTIIYIPEQTVLYRQHAQNVVGAKKTDIHYIIRVFTNLNSTFRTNFKTFKVINSLGKFGVAKYIYYKLLFQFKRYTR